MSPFELATVVIVLAAVLGYANRRLIGLPQTSGLTAIAAVASIAVVLIDRLTPDGDLAHRLQLFLGRIDFHRTLMDGMLSFLLFAGALHVDLHGLRRSWQPILALSTFGVVLSTGLVAAGLWLITTGLGVGVPWAWCLVFGALISPTDPVAVLGLLRHRKVAPELEAAVGGESLFNDGVGVVVFTILLAGVSGGETVTVLSGLRMFVQEAGGGAILGLLLGWIAFRMMRSIDDYSVEVLISLAVVMGGYVLAHHLHVSGPVAMVMAGLVVGNHAAAHAMSDITRDYLVKFWTIVDEILNAALFVLIGLEAVALTGSLGVLAAAIIAVPLVLLIRGLSVGALLLPWRGLLPWRLSVGLLTWGGLRGGISIALALSLPDAPAKNFLVVATCLVVLFSVIVQGPTVGALLQRLGPRDRSTITIQAG